MNPTTPRISNAEWRVMSVLWRESSGTANEVVEALADETDWKPKTVMTLLGRLVKKGALGFEKQGRAYRYHPLVAEEECVKAESRSFLRRVYGDSLKPMMAHFLDEVEMSDDDIEELKRMLDEKRKRP